MKKIGLAITFTFLMVGCGTTSEISTTKQTPLKRGASHYFIKEPVVNLTLGHGAIPGDKTFLGNDELAKEFYKSLNESFTEKKIISSSEAEADAVVEVKMEYTRNFNYGGKALNKPSFSYEVRITKNGEKLAGYSVSQQTTTYGALKDTAVNLEIAAFKWGVDDEPKDITLIAQTIAKEVSSIGK